MQPRPLTDTQAMLRELGLLVGLPIVLGVIVLVVWRPWVTYQVPADTDIYALVSGTWDWTDADSFCVRDPHTIAFSEDRQVMVLTHRLPWTDSAGTERRVWEYDIQEVTRRHVRGLIRGETRRTDAGDPVVWDLVLVAPDRYQWHRTDWLPGSHTQPVQRCPAVYP